MAAISIPSPAASRHKLIGDVHLVLLNQKEQILFGRRFNTGFEDGSWHVPAGHVEAGESVQQALIREANEEVGIVVRAENAEFAHVMHNASGGGRIAFFFVVREWEGEVTNKEPEKCSGLDWFSFDSLPSQLIKYCEFGLTKIRSGEQFSVYGWQ